MYLDAVLLCVCD